MKLPRIFRMAKKASELSDYSQYKVGSCILYKGKVISIGFNQHFKTHPLTRLFHEEQTIHAEVSSIIRLKNKEILKDCKIVVYRQHKDGELAMSRPCPTCIKILKFFKISQIAYTIPGGFAEETLTNG